MPAGYEPVVVDNGSSDGSGTLARRLGARVVQENAPGFGAACFAGLLAARADVVCFMDCDASFDPRDLPLVADPVAAGGADLVLGAPGVGPPPGGRGGPPPSPGGRGGALARARGGGRPAPPRWGGAAAAARGCPPAGRCAPPAASPCSPSACATGASAGRWRWSC